MGSVTPLQVVAVAEKGSGDSRVYEKEKGGQSVCIKAGKPHKGEQKQNKVERLAVLTRRRLR